MNAITLSDLLQSGIKDLPLPANSFRFDFLYKSVAPPVGRDGLDKYLKNCYEDRIVPFSCKTDRTFWSVPSLNDYAVVVPQQFDNDAVKQAICQARSRQFAWNQFIIEDSTTEAFDYFRNRNLPWLQSHSYHLQSASLTFGSDKDVRQSIVLGIDCKPEGQVSLKFGQDASCIDIQALVSWSASNGFAGQG